MIKVRLAILETDKAYMERLITILNNKYQNKIEVYSFNNLNDFKAFLSNGRIKIDVFLCTENIKIDKSILPENCGFAYFCEKNSVDEIYGEKAISKYQKIELIYSSILSLFSDNSSYKIIDDKVSAGMAATYAFLSAAGGVGSSTLAMAAATRFAQKGEKVLYINLELFADISECFNSEGHGNLSDLFYAIKSKSPNIALKIESLLRKSSSGVNYIDICTSLLDLREIKESDMETLVDILTSSCSFNKIIFDIDLNYNMSTLSLLNKADSILMVSDGSYISNQKTLKALNTFSILEEQFNLKINHKLKLIYNKFGSKNGKQIIFDNIVSVGGAPKFDGASTQQIVERLSNMVFLDNI